MKYLIAIYAAVVLFTFGHSAHRYKVAFRGEPDTFLTVLRSLGTSAAWPFYWSYVAFEPAKLEASK